MYDISITFFYNNMLWPCHQFPYSAYGINRMAAELNNIFFFSFEAERRETPKGVQNGHRPRRGFLFFSFEGTSLNRRIRDDPCATKNESLLPVVSSSFSASLSSLSPSLCRFIFYPQRLVQDFFHSEVEIIGFLFPSTRPYPPLLSLFVSITLRPPLWFHNLKEYSSMVFP